jgi:SAM-dependent methyltransferase
MQPASTTFVATPDKNLRTIEYLSPPAPVRMAQSWFEIAPLDHFWVRRRFEVLQRLAGREISVAGELAEVGCGHGLLQRQIEDAYGKQVSGFDLNENALKQSVSRRSKVSCYDIFHRNPALRGKFDLILLFDVLEHVLDESGFLQALLFHLSQSGSLLVNVPAGQWLFSAYDEANGHVRRYTVETLKRALNANNLELESWTYWGLPFVPALFLRKFWLMGKHGESEIMTAGFDSRSSAVNRMMGLLSALEWIPQKFLGTSLMAVVGRANDARSILARP